MSSLSNGLLWNRLLRYASNGGFPILSQVEWRTSTLPDLVISASKWRPLLEDNNFERIFSGYRFKFCIPCFFVNNCKYQRNPPAYWAAEGSFPKLLSDECISERIGERGLSKLQQSFLGFDPLNLWISALTVERLMKALAEGYYSSFIIPPSTFCKWYQKSIKPLKLPITTG